MNRAVFLDRDGTIIEDPGYLHERDKVKFLPGATAAIKLLNKHGFKVIIVTNQAGVARGFFTEETVRDINGYVCELLACEGAVVDGAYYCPHHVDGVIAEYKKECHCRKPNPGMIEDAVRDFGIDLAGSFIIGDRASDVGAGRNAGCRSILLAAQPTPDIPADHVCTSLREAVEWITSSPSPRSR